MVPKSQLLTKGDQAFVVRAPQLWISLPEDLTLGSHLMQKCSDMLTLLSAVAWLVTPEVHASQQVILLSALFK